MKSKSKLSLTFLNRRNYFYKLLIPYIFIFILTICISSLLSYKILRKNMEREVYDQIVYTNKSISSYIDRSIFEDPMKFLLDKFLSNNSYNNLPAFFYEEENPTDLELYDFRQRLKSSMYNYEYIKSVFVYSQKQDMMLSANEGYIMNLLKGEHIEDMSLFNLTSFAIHETNGDIEYYYDSEDERLFMVNSLPLYSTKDSNEGYVFIEIDTKSLISNVNRQYALDDYTIILSNEYYSYIFASKLNNPIYMNIANEDFNRNEPLGIETISLNESKHIISWGKTSNSKIMLTLALPYSSISEKALSLSKTVLSITFIVMLLLLTSVILLTRYLYKPIKKIIKTVKQVSNSPDNLSDMDLINQSFKKLNKQVGTMKQTLYENRQIIEYRLMIDLIQNRIKNITQLNKKLETLNKKLIFNNMFVAIVEFEPIENLDDNIQEYEYTMIKIREMIESSYSNKILLNAVYSANSIILLYVCDDTGKIPYIVEDLHDLITHEINLKFNISLSKSYKNILNTDKAFWTAEKHLDYSFIMGFGNILSYEKIQQYEKNFYVLSADEIKYIEAKVRTGKIDTLKTKIKQITNEMQSKYSISSIHNSLLTILNTLCSIFSEVDVVFSQKQKNKVQDLFDHIECIDDYNTLICSILDNYSELLKNQNSYYDLDDLSQRLLKYIDNNIQDISLATISDNFNMSQGHLSKLFKESTGYGFSEYLIGRKLEIAADFLEKNNKKVKDIAESLGYTKMSYFSKIFKEKYGVTPTQYRKKAM